MGYLEGRLKIEAASASGIEAVTKRELISLGYAPSGAERGRIAFEGDFKDVLRANIFLRTANRVRIVLDSFEAVDFDNLYENIGAFRWEELLDKTAVINVSAKSYKSALFALSSIQSVAKKAILNRLQTAYGLTRFPETGENYDIEISIESDVASVTLDTSGQGLHKRGYRTYLGDAPIRETLAAAMVLLSVYKSERALIDPFCGSGTIPIEAALIALDSAPGINRKFACESFYGAPDVKFAVIDEAEQRIKRNTPLRISGFDINPDAVKLALKHAEKAGVKDKIHFQTMDMRNVSSRYAHGIIITNPPYGERLLNEEELKILYSDFGNVYRSLDKWSAYVITSYRGFEKYFGQKSDKVRKLYNSELNCNFYRFLGAKPSKQTNLSAEE